MRLLALVALAVGLCGHPGASSAQVSPNRELLAPESPEAESRATESQATGFLSQGLPAQPLRQRQFAEDPLAEGGSGEAVRSSASSPHETVVELFTSQGCSSCPAADALLRRLAERDNTIALSLSVDYWDYLG